ncbi:MAG: hypothetical protein WA021_05505 [Minisyncoccia bacterium]
MDRRGWLPKYIRNAWRVHKVEDPVAAAHNSIAAEKKRKLVLTIAGTITIISFFVMIALVNRDMSSTSPEVFLSARPLPLLGVAIVFLVGGALVGVAQLSAPRRVSEYATAKDEFGYEFGELLCFVGVMHTEFSMLTREEAEKKVRSALVDKALLVLQAMEVNDKYRRSHADGDAIPGMKEEKARHDFRASFDRAKLFGLTDPDEYGPYYEEAKAKMSKGLQLESSDQ